MPNHRTLWIHCNYSPERLGRCLRLAESFLGALGLLDGARLVVVDNAAEAASLPAGSRWTRLQGSNRAREFSAWDEGWRWATAGGEKPDLVVLSNDTFPFHQPFAALLGPLLRRRLRRLLAAADGRWALGLVERGFEYRYFSAYVTSFFVVLGTSAIEPAFRELMAWPADSGLEETPARSRVIWSDDPDYESRVNSWLLEPGGWYGASPLSEASFPALREKARCMLLEHALSRRLMAAKVELVSCFDLRWPAGTLARWCYRVWEIADRRRRRAASNAPSSKPT